MVEVLQTKAEKKKHEEEVERVGLEALQLLKSTEPPLFLSPSSELSRAARAASRYLFSALIPSFPKSPLDRLVADDGFDAEQIWHQIHLQTQPLLPSLRRSIRRLERDPQILSSLLARNLADADATADAASKEELNDGKRRAIDDEINDDDDDKIEDGEEEGEDGGGEGIEDRFLKMKELQEYLERDEEREYGLSKEEDDDEDEEDDDDEEDNDKDDEMDGFSADGKGADKIENIRYEDFFGGKKKKSSKKELKSPDGSDDGDAGNLDNQNNGNLSTHEKELLRARAKIEQMEKENLGPKSWTMLGEVTASKRPKNSALEVDLDFEHNVRPAPVITEQVTASLEEMIKKRILEGHFDDVQKAPSLPSKALKEPKELDENKCQKGLAELYEEEYAQKTGLTSAPTSFTDEQKEEASMLFKKLCVKLDALSHFHFTPKPVIEDMSIQTNVPALAMEEIAPMAVSDAAMLAPEEVFTGTGDIKEDAELTQAERKRRRANKKRKFKAETVKRMAAKKARENALTSTNDIEGS